MLTTRKNRREMNISGSFLRDVATASQTRREGKTPWKAIERNRKGANPNRQKSVVEQSAGQFV